MDSFIILLLLAAMLSASLALFVFHRVRAPGSRYLSLLLLAVAVWSACYAAELNSKDLQSMVFWASCAYFGILAVPVSWLAFSLVYTGQDALLTRSNLLLLAIEPVLVIVLVWSNSAHGIF